jgi:hypothetical protein
VTPKGKAKEKDSKRVTYIRLADSLHMRITKLADDERRSFQAQVEMMLELSVIQFEKENKRT